MNIKQYAKIYPRINNDNILDFHIPESRFQVLLNDVKLHFKIKLPAKVSPHTWEFVPQNWFGAKQFSSLEVKINDEIVGHRNMSNEYFLANYFNTIVNYQEGVINTGFDTLGITDSSNMTTAYIKKFPKTTLDNFISKRDKDMEIIMPIQSSVFLSNNILPSNLKWSLSFERAKSTLSCLITDSGVTLADGDIDSVLKLEDVYLTVPYLEHQRTKEKESNWLVKPISLHYDNYDIQRFVLPNGSKFARLNNIICGNLPKAVIFGIMKEDAYVGDYELNATHFTHHGLLKMDIKVDGCSTAGSPYEMTTNHAATPYVRFMDLIGHYENPETCNVMSLQNFKQYHYLHCACLEKESGSLSLEMEFGVDVPEGYIVIVCAITDTELKIDKYGNFETK